ncbi:hypothetical protein VCHA31O73_360045 [Vibrio chagasii]|nr:hypothetical protein VCHA31O73_360045 [Vibrio chagasii]
MTKRFFKNGGTYANDIKEVRQELSQINATLTGSYLALPPQSKTDNSMIIEVNGATLSKKAYPQLWAFVQSTVGSVTATQYSDIVRNSPISMCTRYADLGGDSFRIPTVGLGGFHRFLGSLEQAPIGNIDGGFKSQVEYHKHALPIMADSNAGRVNVGKTDMFGTIKLNQIYHAYAQGAVVNSTGFNNSLSSGDIYHNSGETTPQGGYVKLYLYVGNIASNLPTPTADWLEQQAANTKAIADINTNTSSYAKPSKYSSNNTVIKLPDGTMIQTVILRLPAYAQAQNFATQENWLEPFKEYYTGSWSTSSEVGGGAASELGALYWNGAQIKATTKTYARLDGYSYKTHSSEPVDVIVTGYGRWK